MCFIADRKGRSKPKIAKRDIPVWKIVYDYRNGDIRSIHTDFRYSYGQTYETEITESHKKQNSAADMYVVNRLNEKYGTGEWGRNNLDDLLYIEKGFHSYKNKARAELVAYEECRWLDDGAVKTIKFIVPKGSEYYVDENYLMVSNKIRLDYE